MNDCGQFLTATLFRQYLQTAMQVLHLSKYSHSATSKTRADEIQNSQKKTFPCVPQWQFYIYDICVQRLQKPQDINFLPFQKFQKMPFVKAPLPLGGAVAFLSIMFTFKDLKYARVTFSKSKMPIFYIYFMSNFKGQFVDFKI